ncbi:MAG: glycoside hydrolase family 5 protein [Prevotella sp.]|nr:glycoside hydrolase family 5 protein [Prevotella sp.]
MEKRWAGRLLMITGWLLATTCLHAQAQSAREIAALMAPGWNLGNTMEVPVNSLNAETAWQKTRTSREIIDFVKQQGFRSVRIPCSWHAHFDVGTTHINDEWTARVREIVDYCINSGLYVVLNDHWDGGWLEDSFTDVSETNVRLKSDTLRIIWTQIAEAFKDYDSHLLFAGLNEPSHSQGEFSQEMIDALLHYEQVFVNTIRSAGGNNTQRVLIVQGPNTDIDQTFNHYHKLPNDSVVDRLMVEVHYYTPWNFCGLERDESWGRMFFYWGKKNHVAKSMRNAEWGEEDHMRAQLLKMKQQFTDKGVPVVFGEYGGNWHKMTGKENQKKHDTSIFAFHYTFNRLCREMGMVPMVWDINRTERPTMSVLDRENLTVFCFPAMKGIRKAYH